MRNNVQPKVVDLFCSVGGLSHGLIREGFNVVAGIDNDESCRYGFEHNNKAKFIHKDIRDVSAEDINSLFGDEDDAPRVLVGCAPCQPFSKLNINKATQKEMEPLEQFANLIQKVKPDIVLMENVRGLANTKKHPVFEIFIDALRQDYHFHYEIVDISEYGVPQNRKRLVLLASVYGDIRLIERTHKFSKVTVRDTIGEIEPIEAGEISKSDPLHRSSRLNPLNMQRIKSTPHDGGNFRGWDESLILECHRRESGKTYRRTVYGRMRWNQPAPTMTTQCTSLGTGRHGHPEQDRAISLREAALLQTFPRNYEFIAPNDPVIVKRIAKYIGNAVPVKFAAALGKSIKNNIEHHAGK